MKDEFRKRVERALRSPSSDLSSMDVIDAMSALAVAKAVAWCREHEAIIEWTRGLCTVKLPLHGATADHEVFAVYTIATLPEAVAALREKGSA